MRCRKAKKWISASLDGELDGARNQAVQAHLAACPECRAFAADLAGLTEGLDLLTVPEPRWGFTGRTMARLANPQSRETASRGWLDFLRPAPLGVGAAAFGFGVFLVIMANGEQEAPGAERDTIVALADDGTVAALLNDAIEERLLALLPDAEE